MPRAPLCARAHFALLAAASSCAAGAVSTRADSLVTPVEKVIQLLERLQSQVEEEGKKDATQYDKYACFCKEQADEKLYMIEKSTKKIEKLDANIGGLASEILELDADVKGLIASISNLDTKISQAAKARAQEHAAYLEVDKDLTSAIAAVKGAINALKQSKAQMSGVKLDFAQVRAAASLAVAAASHVAIPETQLSKIVGLSQSRADQNPAAYEYQSNDIIGTLEELLAIFNRRKKETDVDEFDAMSAFEKKDLTAKNIQKFQEQEKAEKEKIREAKTEEKTANELDRDEESKDKNADSDFLKVLRGECETKASQWDQRSQTRSGEVAAIAEALEHLSKEVAPSWGANEKLSDVQTAVAAKAAVVKAKAGSPPAMMPVASFLQLRGKQDQSSSAVARIRKVAQLLSAVGSRLGSSTLVAASVRAQTSDDHFVKVRAIIKDLMARLNADMVSEASRKSDCDRDISDNVANRDGAKEQLETLATETSHLQAEKAQLAKEVAALAADIASLTKALNEATQLRAEERDENGNTVSTASEGKTGVEFALSVLREFYSANAAPAAFAQYVPIDSDREGKTVADRAPEVWAGHYHGSQSDSKGIIGLLEVILSDFDRTISTTTEEERVAQEDFQTFQSDTENEIRRKVTSKGTKEDRISSIEDELTQNAGATMDQQSLLDAVERSLAAKKKLCVDGEETYEERVAKREKEIEALREAQKILDEWQG